MVGDEFTTCDASTRLPSRAATLTVIRRHSRAEAGRESVSVSSCSQSSAEISACSGPNNFVTAPKNPDNSRSAIFNKSPQSALEFFDGLSANACIIANLPTLKGEGPGNHP